MLYGLVANWHRDKTFFPAVFDAAFVFLAEKDLSALADGTYPIDGKRIYASVQRVRTQDERERRFEAHRQYLDIQVLLAGREKHLHAPDLAGMTMTEDFLRERDLAFYTPPDFSGSLILGPGHYAVYFPGEPHAPCCAVTGDGEDITKVVFKILWAN